MTNIPATPPTSFLSRIFGRAFSPSVATPPAVMIAKTALDTLTADQKNTVPDFYKNYFLPMARDITKANSTLSSSTLVITALKAKFGADLVMRVATRYGLNTKTSFDLNDLSAMLVGIAVHCKTEHLRARLNQLRNNNPAWKDAGELETLTKQQLNQLVSHFREQLPLAVLPNIQLNGTPAQNALLKEDVTILQKFNLAGQYEYKVDQEIGNSEYFGHVLAYREMEEGDIVPVKTGNNEISYFRVSATVYGKGFASFVFVPLERTAPGKPLNIYVSHRGTDPQNIESKRRCVGEKLSPGHESYPLYGPKVMQAVCNAIPNDVQEVRLLSCGHSMGAADTMRTTCLALTEIAAAKKAAQNNPALRDHPLLKIREIKTVPFNGAGVAQETADMIIKMEQAINEHGVMVIDEEADRFEDDDGFLVYSRYMFERPASQVQLTFRPVIVAGDPVQRTGVTQGWAGLVSPHVDVQVVKYDHGHEGWKPIFTNFGLNGFRAHTVHNTPTRKQSQVLARPQDVQRIARRQFFADSGDWPRWQETKARFSRFLLGRN